MRFTSILSSTAVMAMASASDLALYWGQASGGAHQDSLGDYCKNSAGDIYLISFLNSFGSGRELSMEVSGYWNNLPGTQLPDAASTIGADIKTCQSLGKKVLISMGGASGSYGFSSDADAQKVAQDLWNTFGGGQSSTRPFGDAKIDGFDLDVENNLNADEYTAFVNELRQLYASDPSKQYYVSAAPQCPFPDASVGQAVAHAQFDFLFVQFYNNYCTPLGTSFNWDTWQNFASSQSPNRNVKLFLGLPGAQSAAGSGYATPDQVKQTIEKIHSTPNFGGIMLWDAAQANGNHVDGTTFAQEMKNILNENGPAPAPAPSSSAPAPVPATSSSSSSSSSSAAAPAWTPDTSSSSAPAAAGPAGAPTSSSSSTAAPAWTPEASSSSAAAPAWAPQSSSSSPAGAWTPETSAEGSAPGGAPVVQPTTVTSYAGNGAPVVVTKEETFYTTSSCSTSSTPAAPVNEAAVETVQSTTTAAASPVSLTTVPTSTATKVTKSAGSNGEDVWVTVHETFYTTQSCDSTPVATAGSEPQTSTVHSTSYVQTTVPGVTTTQTSYGPRETSAEHHYHDFTSDGEVYVYDTVWTTAYTTRWVR